MHAQIQIFKTTSCGERCYNIEYLSKTGMAEDRQLAGANVHILVFTDLKNNGCQKKLIRQNINI